MKEILIVVALAVISAAVVWGVGFLFALGWASAQQVLHTVLTTIN